MFFCAKNDEGENCQQRKVLTSSPIRIAQFHEKSFFKSTKNYVKSHGFEQASVGVSNRNSKKTLETCCFKKQQKALALPEASKRQNEPAKPKSHLTSKAVKTKKEQHFFAFFKT